MQHHRTPVQYSFVAFLFYSKKGTEVAFDVASCWPLRCSMERRQASKRRAERSLANGRAALLACLAAALLLVVHGRLAWLPCGQSGTSFVTLETRLDSTQNHIISEKIQRTSEAPLASSARSSYEALELHARNNNTSNGDLNDLFTRRDRCVI